MPLPNFYLVGCQKTASTWLYQCFREHPDIYVPDIDAIHFFTIHYHKNLSWYESFFSGHQGQAGIGDTTPSYYRHPYMPERLHKHTPDAKLIFSFRNPIDRAFSHYWHEKKKHKIAFEFAEVLENYDLFDNWVVSGFYYQHLQRFYDYFPPEQILILIYEDLKTDPHAFLKQTLDFLEVDAEFTPSVINRRVNQAYYRPPVLQKPAQIYSRLPDSIRKLIPDHLIRTIKQTVKGDTKTEYEHGMAPATREKLREILQPENNKLAQHIRRDLSMWV